MYFIFIWLGLMVFIPNLLVLLASFLSKDPKYFLSLPLNLENYKALFDTVLFGVILKSLNIAFFTTVFCLVVGYPFAYFIARAPKEWRSLFLMLIIVPFWTNSLIRNYALISILSTNGLLNTFLLKIGVISQPIQILYSDWAVFIGMSYTLLPFMILPLYTTLIKMDKSLIEASADLGGNAFTTFTKVTLPLSMPGIVSGITMVFMPTMTNYVISDTLGLGHITIIGKLIEECFGSRNDWYLGSAIALVLLFIIFISMLFTGGFKDEENGARGAGIW